MFDVLWEEPDTGDNRNICFICVVYTLLVLGYRVTCPTCFSAVIHAQCDWTFQDNVGEELGTNWKRYKKLVYYQEMNKSYGFFQLNMEYVI